MIDRIHTKARVYAAALLVALAAIAIGCHRPQQDQSNGKLLTQGQTIFAKHDKEVKSSRNTYVLAVRMVLTTVEVPVGSISSSDDIWSYLDTESVRQVRTPAIGRNGFRVGRGQGELWNDVARILKRLTGRELQRSSVMAPPGKPVPIVLKTDQPFQTVFIFRQDGTFHGLDLPPGDNIINIVCTLNEDDPSRLLITGIPQVRTSRRHTRLIESGGGVLMVAKPSYHSLTDMTFQVPMDSNDFLVIAPGADSDRPSSIGSKFLVKQKNGMDFETVIVIRPEVLAGAAQEAS